MIFPRILLVGETEQKVSRFESVFKKENKTGTSQVGAISKPQKAQNIFFGKKLEIFEKKMFFRKMSHSAEKCKRGDPFSFINTHSVAK